MGGGVKTFSKKLFGRSNDVAMLVETLEPYVLGIHARFKHHIVLKHTSSFLQMAAKTARK